MKERQVRTLTAAEAERSPSFQTVYSRIKQTLSCPATHERFRLQPNAFTRQRDLPFACLVTFMLNLRKGSTEQKLAGLCAVLDDEATAGNVPTRAAFCKARKALSDQLYSHLNRVAIETFCGGFSTPLWHGFRLRAVDGTTFRLPPGEALRRAFRAQESGPTLGRGSILYDTGQALVLDAHQCGGWEFGGAHAHDRPTARGFADAAHRHIFRQRLLSRGDHGLVRGQGGAFVLALAEKQTPQPVGPALAGPS